MNNYEYAVLIQPESFLMLWFFCWNDNRTHLSIFENGRSYGSEASWCLQVIKKIVFFSSMELVVKLGRRRFDASGS